MDNFVRMWMALGISLFIFSGTYAATPLKVPVSAEGAILINAENGNVLFEKNADTSFFPASITKVASSLFLLEKYPHRLREMVTVSPLAVTWAPVHLKRGQPSRYPSFLLEQGATYLHLQEGEIVSAMDLFQGMLIHSANDAMNALAEHMSGSIPNFTQELNVYLKQKGYKNTHFDNPHGLHHSDHYSTARDMAFLAREAMKIPLFRETVRKEKGLKPATNKQAPHPYAQGNRLLRPGKFFYPYATGIKTGHMSKSKFTLIASAEKGERSVIAVLLGCQENDGRYRDAINLFEAAFNEKKTSRLLLTKEDEMFTLSIEGAKQALKAQMKDDLSWSYYPSEEPNLKTVISWDVHHLPIQKGQTVGILSLVDQNNTVLKKMPLTAISSIEPTVFWRVRHFTKNFMAMRLTKTVLLGMFFVTAITFWYCKRLRKRETLDSDKEL